jgi:hypothetical protein
MSSFRWILLVFVLLVACEKEVSVSRQIAKIRVDVDIDRFEEKFYKTDTADFEFIKKEYPFMFPESIHDSIWLQKIESEQEQFLFEESQRVHGDLSVFKFQLNGLFQHVKYYDSNFKVPKIITLISDLDFDYPVIDADSLLFVSLDMYLGAKSEVYQYFPKYIAQNYSSERMIIDVANELFKRYYLKLNSRTFIHRMINEAKFLVALDVYLPLESDQNKIGFTQEKLDWAKRNELDVWKYFREHELLYSNDASLNSRFIDIAPFSKFYRQSDKDSPGRIGKWIGWQIVRSYMKNNDVTLQQLMKMDPEEIFRKSKYKPRKY